MKFVNSRNITFKKVTLGHTISGECFGGVLDFESSENIQIEDSILYGTGVLGVNLVDVKEFHFSNSTIKDCSVILMNVRNSYNVYFENSIFENTGPYDLIQIEGTSNNVHFSYCTIKDNWTTDKFVGYLFAIGQESGNVYLNNSRVINNRVTGFANNISKLIMANNVFSGNAFTDYSDQQLNRMSAP